MVATFPGSFGCAAPLSSSRTRITIHPYGDSDMELGQSSRSGGGRRSKPGSTVEIKIGQRSLFVNLPKSWATYLRHPEPDIRKICQRRMIVNLPKALLPYLDDPKPNIRAQPSFFVVEANNYDYDVRPELIKLIRRIYVPTQSGYMLHGERIRQEEGESEGKVFLIYENAIPLVPKKRRKKDVCLVRFKELACAFYQLFNDVKFCNLANNIDSIVYGCGSAKLSGCNDVSPSCWRHKIHYMSCLFDFFEDNRDYSNHELEYFAKLSLPNLLLKNIPLEVLYHHPVWLSLSLNRLYARVWLHERLSSLTRIQLQDMEIQCIKIKRGMNDWASWRRSDWGSWRSIISTIPAFKQVYVYIHPHSSAAPSPPAPASSAAPFLPSATIPHSYPIISKYYHANELVQFGKFGRNLYFHNMEALGYDYMEANLEDCWSNFSVMAHHLLVLVAKNFEDWGLEKLH